MGGRAVATGRKPSCNPPHQGLGEKVGFGVVFVSCFANQLARFSRKFGMSRYRFLQWRFAWLLPALGLLATTSCTLRETRQEVTPSAEPRFTVRAVEQASLGTLDVLPLRTPADVTLPRRNQLIEGYVNKDLPLKMRLQLSAYNPNLEAVTVTGLDYTVLIDNKVLGAGRLSLALNLPARDSVRLPLSFEFNTYKLLGDDALPALRNFALGFGDLSRQRVTLRLHPMLRNGRGRLSSRIRPEALPVVASREKAPPAPVRTTADAPVKLLRHGGQPL